MPNFQLGLSALRASQFSIDLVSNNVANANNEGYHRRRVHLAETEPQLRGGYRVGTGVTVSRVQRVRDQVTEASLTKVTSDSNRVDQLLTLQKKIESAVLTGGNAVGEQMDQFFTEFTSLSASP